jgi:hypothetical protein
LKKLNWHSDRNKCHRPCKRHGPNFMFWKINIFLNSRNSFLVGPERGRLSRRSEVCLNNKSWVWKLSRAFRTAAFWRNWIGSQSLWVKYLATLKCPLVYQGPHF